jgi:hypothetical protein
MRSGHAVCVDVVTFGNLDFDFANTVAEVRGIEKDVKMFRVFANGDAVAYCNHVYSLHEVETITILR